MPLADVPLSLYVHFPWCVRKCPYCDFNSYTLRDELPEERYVAALEADLELQAREVAGREVISIFMGGGTPSLFSPEAIARVLAAARRHLRLADDVEVTLEANPGTIERGRFAEYRAAGVNRVSLGAQSFDAARLEALGRIHSPRETVRAAEELHAAGLTNFNLDLMYGLPGQDLPGALRDIEQALALEPAHVSHYQLTIEPGTVFAGVRPSLPTDEEIADMLPPVQERLAAAGFAQYEVSAYARPTRRCRHNLNYWTFGDYLGIGAGAHGKLTSAASGTIVRTSRIREPRRYLSSSAEPPVRREVQPAELPFEFAMNALRLTEGFSMGLFSRRTGLGAAAIEPTLSVLETRGLVARDGDRWYPTVVGLRFLNDALIEFLPDTPESAGKSRLSSAP